MSGFIALLMRPISVLRLVRGMEELSFHHRVLAQDLINRAGGNGHIEEFDSVRFERLLTEMKHELGLKPKNGKG